MTRIEMTAAVAEDAGITKAAAGRIIDHIGALILIDILEDGKSALPRIGIFTVKARAARVFRNPLNGEAVFKPARKVLTFKPTAEIKRRLAGQAE